MKLTPLQQYLIIGLAVFVGLSFLYYQFLLKPIDNNISALQTKLEQEKKDLEDAKKTVAKYVEFKKRADGIQRELEWLQNRIPQTIDRPKMLEAVSFLQSRSGVTLTAFQFQTQSAAAAGTSYSEVPVNVKFTSDYRGLLKFLNQIGLSNLFMTVKDVVITASPDSNNPNNSLTAQMVVSGIQAK